MKMLDENWYAQKLGELREQWVATVEDALVSPKLSKEMKRNLARYLTEEDKAWRGKLYFYDEEFEEQSSLLRVMEEIDDID